MSAWPSTGSVELIDARDATLDQRRGALPPSRACRLLTHVALGMAGRRENGSRLHALIQETAGLGRLGWLDERELLALLSDQVRDERLLVVPVVEVLPAALPIFAAEAETVAPAPEPFAEPPPAMAAAAAPPTDVEPPMEVPLLDVVAQVHVLRQAARAGVPFCEECAAAARRGAAARSGSSSGAARQGMSA